MADSNSNNDFKRSEIGQRDNSDQTLLIEETASSEFDMKWKLERLVQEYIDYLEEIVPRLLREVTAKNEYIESKHEYILQKEEDCRTLERDRASALLRMDYLERNLASHIKESEVVKGQYDQALSQNKSLFVRLGAIETEFRSASETIEGLRNQIRQCEKSNFALTEHIAAVRGRKSYRLTSGIIDRLAKRMKAHNE